MKQVYIAEPSNAMLDDLSASFARIDPDGSKYRLHINPLGNTPEQIRTASLGDILTVTGCEALNLLVLPLHLSEDNRTIAVRDPYNAPVAEFDGVQLALRYQREGNKYPILLTTDRCYTGTQEINVQNTAEIKTGEADLLEDLYRVYAFNLYSPLLPDVSKELRLRLVLEGEPEVIMDEMNGETGQVYVVEPRRPTTH